MRFNNIFCVCATTLTLLCVTAPSYALLANTQYFDFSGWNHAQVAGAGQMFNIGPGLTVTVQAVGAFSVPSSFSGGSIRSGHLNANETNEFRFTFNQALPIVVKSATVDSQEEARIFGVGAEDYFHDFGAAATVSPFGSGIGIVGNGTGISATGAARGETVTFANTDPGALVIQHISMRTNKYEQFMVGTIIPEPSSLGLLATCLLGLGVFRKRG